MTDRLLLLIAALTFVTLVNLINALVFLYVRLVGRLISTDRKIVTYLIFVFVLTAGTLVWIGVELWLFRMR